MAMSEDDDDEPSDDEIVEYESYYYDESDQASELELLILLEFSQDQPAKWVGSQCMAILEDWGSTAELPAFNTCVHE